MPPKRPPIATAATAASIKRKRTTAVVGPGKKKGGGVAIPSEVSSSSSSSSSINQQLYDEFIHLLSKPQYKGRGIANSVLKVHFESRYPELVPIINALTRSSRLTMSKQDEQPTGGMTTTTTASSAATISEVYFSLLSMEEATKLQGLDAPSKMVYQVIEASGSRGIWTVDIRVQTNIQQATLTKIFKQLETRRLIKPIKAVTAKTKKLYMVYDVTPAKEITGGPWYSEYEFDHEFIAELRNFILMCITRMNGGAGVGNGVTLQQIVTKMIQANVSRVQLSLNETLQLLQTLILDYIVEQHGVTEQGEAVYVAAKPLSNMCDFGWWDVLSTDFHFRGILFEDGVYLAPHEPHHHS